MKATGNVRSISVVDPETGNISVFSRMEVADDNLTFQILMQIGSNLKGCLLSKKSAVHMTSVNKS